MLGTKYKVKRKDGATDRIPQIVQVTIRSGIKLITKRRLIRQLESNRSKGKKVCESPLIENPHAEESDTN